MKTSTSLFFVMAYSSLAPPGSRPLEKRRLSRYILNMGLPADWKVKGVTREKMISTEKMLIGEAARRAGLGPKTLRYYEEIGLVAPYGRTPKGYRLYGAEELRRLSFVKKAKALGFTLSDIGDVLALTASGKTPCGEVEARAQRKIEELEEKIGELERLKGSLQALLGWRDEAEVGSSYYCPRIEGVPPLARKGS